MTSVGDGDDFSTAFTLDLFLTVVLLVFRLHFLFLVHLVLASLLLVTWVPGLERLKTTSLEGPACQSK